MLGRLKQNDLRAKVYIVLRRGRQLLILSINFLNETKCYTGISIGQSSTKRRWLRKSIIKYMRIKNKISKIHNV